MSKLDTLRKLIREEVRAAIQEQLAEILKEAITVNSASKQRMTENSVSDIKKASAVPGTLNTRKAALVPPQLTSNNPLNSLLSETARSMTMNDMTSLNFNSNDVPGFGGGMSIQTDVPVAPSVNEMLASARPSSNMDMVEINTVPDFTELMGNLRAKGVL